MGRCTHSRNQDNKASPFPYPLTAPYTGAPNVLFEGYGAATPQSAQRAVDVLLGRAQLPERPFEDQFFALDQAVRDTLWGGYDRDGDGTTDFEGIASGLGVTAAGVTSVADALGVLRKVAEIKNPNVGLQPLGANSQTYYLHRRMAADPGVTGCGPAINESYMDTQDTPGDLELRQTLQGCHAGTGVLHRRRLRAPRWRERLGRWSC